MAICMLELTDDRWATRSAIEGLASAFSGTTAEIRRIDPRDYGASVVGHMGFFRSANGPAMWPIARDALALQAPAPA